MPQLASNIVYLKIDGVEVSAYFKAVTLNVTANTQDITMGSGTNYVQKAAGLLDASISITLGYDTSQVQAQIQHLRPGITVEIEYGPEGAVSGKPRHVQRFLLTGNSLADNVDKTASVFGIAGEAAEGPSIDAWAGAVYA